MQCNHNGIKEDTRWFYKDKEGYKKDIRRIYIKGYKKDIEGYRKI